MKHERNAANGTGDNRYAACSCGWRSPLVCDARTAAQAYEEHASTARWVDHVLSLIDGGMTLQEALEAPK